MPRAGPTRVIVRAAASLAGDIGFPAVTIDLLARPLGGRAPPLGKHRCQPVIAPGPRRRHHPAAYRAAYQGRSSDAREAGP